MIKRFRFDGAPGAITCTVIPELCVPAPPPHLAVTIERFADLAAVGAVDPARDLVADEVVRRGGDWLAARWREGGTRWKHMALARRAPALTPEELSERWRAHGAGVGANPIPEEVRGCAYVQNHPLAAGPYDAVNEVWFDDVDGLRARAEWFRANVDPLAPDELFARSWFLAVREDVGSAEIG